MDWTAGYASDVEYTAGFYHEQSPSFLNFVCVLNGYQPVRLDGPFSYFELGFGRGLTVNVLAAANPQGQFYAADFNPAHVAGARDLANDAGLSNLTLFEESFEELARSEKLDLPQFDYITLHGIYTWVTKENQQHILTFINKYLKPGGVVYLSYNTMPGWAAVTPLQRLLVEYADAFPDRSNLQVDRAATLISKMELADARYFKAHPSLQGRLEEIKGGNRNYLVHEYMHRHWEPRYHADVARDLASVKMDYVGSADLPFAFENLYLDEEKFAIVNAIPDPAMRETMKDYFFNTSFRKDVFVRGSRKLNPQKQSELLSQVGAVLLKPKTSVTLDLKLSIGEVQGKPELFNPVLDALASGPRSIGQLMAMLGLKADGAASLAQIFALLAATGSLGIYWAAAEHQSATSAQAMNRAIARSTLYGDEYQVLASPLCGNGLYANYVDRLAYLASLDMSLSLTPDALASRVWGMINDQGKRVIKDGKVIEGEQESKEEILQQVTSLIEHRLLVWEHLKIR